MGNNISPLVSVVVITYNSSLTVVETLDSIKSQSYSNIELIVSDDCSKDGTSMLVKSWLQDNGAHFKSAKLIQTEANSGVTGNCNFALNQVSGEWVKIIAGDDLLEASAIDDIVCYAREHKGVEALHTDYAFFGDRRDTRRISRCFGALSARQQLKYLLINHEPAYGVYSFAKKSALLRVGGFDERYPDIEDLPMAIRLAASGVKVDVLPKTLVRYRLSSLGISGGSGFGDRLWSVLNSCAVPMIIKNKYYFVYLHHFVDLYMHRRGGGSGFHRRVAHYLIKAFDFYSWVTYLKRRGFESRYFYI